MSKASIGASLLLDCCVFAGHGNSASAPAFAPEASNAAAAASAPAPGAVTSASVGRRLLAQDLS